MRPSIAMVTQRCQRGGRLLGVAVLIEVAAIRSTFRVSETADVKVDDNNVALARLL